MSAGCFATSKGLFLVYQHTRVTSNNTHTHTHTFIEELFPPLLQMDQSFFLASPLQRQRSQINCTDLVELCVKTSLWWDSRIFFLSVLWSGPKNRIFLTCYFIFPEFTSGLVSAFVSCCTPGTGATRGPLLSFTHLHVGLDGFFPQCWVDYREMESLLSPGFF